MPDPLIESAGLVDFYRLVTRAGTVEGARPLFEQLTNDVVALTHPEVRSIIANPGDWGIDAFVGDLDGGNVGIWQSKFFLDKCDGDVHQREIRDSYKSALNSAVAHGYTLSTWTLAIPSDMTPKMTQWWDGWKKRTEAKDKVLIDLWTGGHLRRRLMPEAARAVRDYWFSAHAPAPPGRDGSAEDQILWQEVANEGGEYDEFLFVHQLEHALMTETQGAREAFFNAEILEAEIADKAVPREIGALRSWRARIGLTWETNFNHIASTSEGKQLPGLYSAVMTDIDHNHEQHAAALRAQTMHGQGLMHQQVESANAGWVRDWREVAAAHSGTTAATAASQPATMDSRATAPEPLAAASGTGETGTLQ